MIPAIWAVPCVNHVMFLAFSSNQRTTGSVAGWELPIQSLLDGRTIDICGVAAKTARNSGFCRLGSGAGTDLNLGLNDDRAASVSPFGRTSLNA
jgi:hypothetical protein